MQAGEQKNMYMYMEKQEVKKNKKAFNCKGHYGYLLWLKGVV